MDQIRVFIGFDNRHPLTYRACLNTIRINEGYNLDTRPIVQNVVRAEGLYWREPDLKASTEFSLTRFLVPWLVPQPKRFALFCDSDFLFTGPLESLLESTIFAQPGKALWVVKHDAETILTNTKVSPNYKMNGDRQYLYPRKWWSALMLWDLEHPAHRRLSLTDVNDRPPSYLHRFEWLADDEIGDIDETWHWLDGYNDPPAHGVPAGIHFTRGTPEMGPTWQKTKYAGLWYEAVEIRTLRS